MMWPDQMGSTFCDPATQQHAIKAMNAMSMWQLEQCHSGYAAASKIDPTTAMAFPLNHFAQQLTAAQHFGFPGTGGGSNQGRSSSDLSSPTQTGKRKKPTPIPEESKDEAYRERRRRNNDSAKRSREQRRQAEDMNKRRLDHLAYENHNLKMEINLLRCELEKFRNYLASQNSVIP